MAKRTKIDRLFVYQNFKSVGTLERAPSGAISFEYAESWLEDKNAFPISLHLPLQETAFKGAGVASYFDKLLPDNQTSRRVLLSLQVE